MHEQIEHLNCTTKLDFNIEVVFEIVHETKA